MRLRTKSHARAAAAVAALLLATTRVSGDDPDAATVTPIKHLVVIFQENDSFDH